MLDLGFAYKNGRRDRPLDGKTLAMIFEKPSTRTRVSFEVAMRQLGGDVIMLDTADSQLGRGETVADTARVLSRYVDAIMIRTNHAEKLDDLARYATVPVINGLTDCIAPLPDHGRRDDACRKRRGRSPTRSWPGAATATTSRSAGLHAAARFGFELRLACPDGLAAAAGGHRLGAARGRPGPPRSREPVEAVAGADCVVTDTWVSMGAEASVNRHNLLAPYRVDERADGKSQARRHIHALPAGQARRGGHGGGH